MRDGDAKGRHTTTSRQLHTLAGGGVVIDTPGIREVGLAGDEDAVDATFVDIDELAADCRFSDCAHEGEPGCAVAAAVEAGVLQADRLAAFLTLRREAAAAAVRADEAAKRAEGRQASKGQRSYYQQHPGRKGGDPGARPAEADRRPGPPVRSRSTWRPGLGVSLVPITHIARRSRGCGGRWPFSLPVRRSAPFTILPCLRLPSCTSGSRPVRPACA